MAGPSGPWSKTTDLPFSRSVATQRNGNGEIVETVDRGIGKSDAAQEKADAMAGIEAALKTEAVTKARVQLHRVAPIVFLAAL